MKKMQRGLNTSQMRLASRPRTQGFYFASLTVRSISPLATRGCALERGTDSNNHNLQITRGMASVLRPGEKLSPKDQSLSPWLRRWGQGHRGRMGQGSQKPGLRYEKSQVGRRASFLPSAGPGTRPARAPVPEPRVWASPPGILGNPIQCSSTWRHRAALPAGASHMQTRGLPK